jgi:hypothetical protein
MFGREVSGVANATPDLPKGCRWVLTPGGRTTAGALDAVRALARVAGAAPLLMPADEHDRRVAVASHLPQLAATALAAAAEAAEQRLGGVLALAASGFRDTTRLAASPAELWTDILLTNRAPVLEALAGFRQTLGAMEAIEAAGLNPGKDIVIITVDGEQKAIDLLKKGKINCVVECTPMLGDAVMELAKKLAAGQVINRVTYSTETVFTEFDTGLDSLPERGY